MPPLTVSSLQKNIIEKGIPGSGHTHPNHPVYDFVKPLLDAQQAEQLEQTVAASRMNYDAVNEDPSPIHIQEIDLQQSEQSSEETLEQQASTDLESTDSENTNDSEVTDAAQYLYGLLAFTLLLMVAGFVRARRF